MSLDQYNSLMSSMLNQQYTLTRLKAKLEESVRIVKSLDIWPITAGTRMKRKRENQSLGINLMYC